MLVTNSLTWGSVFGSKISGFLIPVLDSVSEWCRKFQVEGWKSYKFMQNLRYQNKSGT